MMTVLLDLNVLLDAFLGREPWRTEVDAIWNANRDGRIAGRVSAAALPTLFYVVRKQNLKLGGCRLPPVPDRGMSRRTSGLECA